MEKLENNQKLLYYQLSMYQSRDIAKNIYNYFWRDLKIRNDRKPFYDLKNIMAYLNNNNNELYDEQKKKIKEIFQIIIFYQQS